MAAPPAGAHQEAEVPDAAQAYPAHTAGRRLRRKLLAILAHELRRPLTALLGALATLQQRHHALSVLRQQELLGMAHRQSEQLGQLLDQLLAAAGLERGHAYLARRSLVDAAALTEEAGRAAWLAHPDHPITIEVAGPLLVRVDPLAVGRILGNLLDNAAASSPPGTPIRLSAPRDGVHALLAVQDHGPGIPPTSATGSSSPTRACTIRPPRLAVGLALACTSLGD